MTKCQIARACHEQVDPYQQQQLGWAGHRPEHINHTNRVQAGMPTPCPAPAPARARRRRGSSASAALPLMHTPMPDLALLAAGKQWGGSRARTTNKTSSEHGPGEGGGCFPWRWRSHGRKLGSALQANVPTVVCAVSFQQQAESGASLVASLAGWPHPTQHLIKPAIQGSRARPAMPPTCCTELHSMAQHHPAPTTRTCSTAPACTLRTCGGLPHRSRRSPRTPGHQ